MLFQSGTMTGTMIFEKTEAFKNPSVIEMVDNITLNCMSLFTVCPANELVTPTICPLIGKGFVSWEFAARDVNVIGIGYALIAFAPYLLPELR